MPTTRYRIERDILIEAPVEVVWRTVTEPSQITQWFAAEVELEVLPGSRGYMGFGDQGGPVLVETVEPPTRFSFWWNHPTGAELEPGNAVLVEFTLVDEGGHTRLQVTETGLDPLAWPDADKDRYTEEHNQGWGHFLGQLAELLASRA